MWGSSHMFRIAEELTNQILWFLTAHTPTGPVIGAPGQEHHLPWASFTPSLSLHTARSQAPFHKQPRSTYSRHTINSWNKLAYIPHRHLVSSETRLCLKGCAHKNTLLEERATNVLLV